MGLEIQENVALGPLTTMGVGGAARWFAEARTETDVAEAAAWAAGRGLPMFVLGGGSNLLVGDGGYAGLVLRMEIGGIKECGDGCFEVGAGVSWDEFVSRTVSAGYAGVECLAGIPGSVGGTPVQNVGAYGQDVAETIESVWVFDREQTVFAEMTREECRFRYRESRFNTDEPGRFVVLRVRFRLRAGGKPELKYAELRKRFGLDGVPEGPVETRVPDAGPGAPRAEVGPGVGEVAAAVREIRRGKGMLIVEGDPDARSAGSFFKNPVVGEDRLAVIAAAAHMGVEDVPRWPAGPGRVKLPAAWLLERAGFVKGYGTGRAGISTKHTLAVVNRGGARCADVERLQEEIVGCVAEMFGVGLVREPVKL
jgi:UDP-N-acetylmuramate dehydrogenase